MWFVPTAGCPRQPAKPWLRVEACVTFVIWLLKNSISLSKGPGQEVKFSGAWFETMKLVLDFCRDEPLSPPKEETKSRNAKIKRLHLFIGPNLPKTRTELKNLFFSDESQRARPWGVVSSPNDTGHKWTIWTWCSTYTRRPLVKHAGSLAHGQANPERQAQNNISLFILITVHE